MGIDPLRSRRAVFLDRDGVLNEPIVIEGKPFPPRTLAELKIDSDAPRLLSLLRERGFVLIVVTNQPDVARKTQTRRNVEAIHGALSDALPLDSLMTCYHDDDDQCACRKPKPGMLLAAAAEQHLNLAQSFLVGDRWRDIDAGVEAGCRTILIDRGYQERPPSKPPDVTVRTLTEAVTWILQQP